MTEPRRWLEDAAVPPTLKDLLAVDVEAELPPQVRARVAGKLAVTLGISMGAASLTTKAAASVVGQKALSLGGAASPSLGASSAGGLSLSSLVWGGALSVAIGGTAALGIVSLDVADPVPSVNPPPAGSAAAPPLTGAFASAATPAAVPSALTPSVLTPDSDVVSSDTSRSGTGRSGYSRRSFEAEALQLQQASRLLAVKPAAALALLRQHTQDYPHSPLSAERAVLRLRALLALGRSTEAEALGTKLLQDAGAKLYHARVEGLLHEARANLNTSEQSPAAAVQVPPATKASSP